MHMHALETQACGFWFAFEWSYSFLSMNEQSLNPEEIPKYVLADLF